MTRRSQAINEISHRGRVVLVDAVGNKQAVAYDKLATVIDNQTSKGIVNRNHVLLKVGNQRRDDAEARFMVRPATRKLCCDRQCTYPKYAAVQGDCRGGLNLRLLQSSPFYRVSCWVQNGNGPHDPLALIDRRT
jgi:hypothetical protein